MSKNSRSWQIRPKRESKTNEKEANEMKHSFYQNFCAFCAKVCICPLFIRFIFAYCKNQFISESNSMLNKVKICNPEDILEC